MLGCGWLKCLYLGGLLGGPEFPRIYCVSSLRVKSVSSAVSLLGMSLSVQVWYAGIWCM